RLKHADCRFRDINAHIFSLVTPLQNSYLNFAQIVWVVKYITVTELFSKDTIASATLVKLKLVVPNIYKTKT
uniref:hypothetical protein n=1 Tax=Chamaesiphon sp. OTE_8_metabat_110 TaxID=2964696 RepID=UPI00286B00B0